VFRDTCVREARNYIEHHAPLWPFRGRGDGGGLGTLTPADHNVLDAVDQCVRGEVSAILAWLAGRADDEGRVGEPVQIATGLLARLCGDRRVNDAGQRRRTTTIAIAELERIGVLTMAHNYCVGQRGRLWSCWYQFGSGALSRPVNMAAAAWEELAPRPSGIALAPALALAAPPETARDAVSAPIVTVRVVGERVVPEGLLRILSDGVRGVPRTLLSLAPEAGSPTVGRSARAPWFVRPFQRPFTPAELWTADLAKLVPFPDLEARRRMSRRERLALGGGLAPVTPLHAQPNVLRALSPPVIAVPGVLDDAEPEHVVRDCTASQLLGGSVGRDTPQHVELATVLGDAVEQLPEDLADVLEGAWRAFKGRGGEPDG
jgi:hypothetical protein